MSIFNIKKEGIIAIADTRITAGNEVYSNKKISIHEIKNHPFFKGLDWENLRNSKSPFHPKIKDEEDCSRFDKFEEEQPFYPSDEVKSKNAKKRKDIHFPGYTYKKEVED